MTKEGGKSGIEGKRRDYLRRKGRGYEEARKEKTERILEEGMECSESSEGNSQRAENGDLREKKR